MQDSELKKLLIETCPVLPGQEERAWKSLRERLYAPKATASQWSTVRTWRTAAIAFATIAVILFVGNFAVISLRPAPFASADSQAPGIYATSFYSHSAKAQVIWINGLEPASDKPTFMDPTAAVPRPEDNAKPTGDPNSL